MDTSIGNVAASIAALKTAIQSELPDAHLDNATIEVTEIDPTAYAMASDKESATKSVSEAINELRASDLFASHYVHMMHYGVNAPIILERTADGSVDLVDGEMRCTIALARGEKVQAIILSGHTWGRSSTQGREQAKVEDEINF